MRRRLARLPAVQEALPSRSPRLARLLAVPGPGDRMAVSDPAEAALLALAGDLIDEIAAGRALELAQSSPAPTPVARPAPEIPDPKKGAGAVHPQLGSHLLTLPGDTISGHAHAHVPRVSPVAFEPGEARIRDMTEPEVIVSIDIETDGPCPGLNSMLALGAVAYDQWENQLGTWYSTFAPLLDADQDPETMAWWETQPEAYAEVSGSRNSARDMIRDFGFWCEALRGTPVVVAWPAVFDFAFTSYYLHRFLGRNPLGYDALDIRSYANGIVRSPDYRGLTEREIYALAGPIDATGWRPHHALDDAAGQGRLFLGLRRYALRNPVMASSARAGKR